MYDRIDRLLFENGLNDAALAQIAGVGKSTVSGWRSGKYNPKEDKLKKIANYFNVSVEWLVGIDDYKTKAEQETMDILFESKAQKSENKELFEVAAGQGYINSDYPGGNSPTDYNYDSGEYVDAVIHGNSMYPIIMDGDVITIKLEPITRPNPKNITVVKIDDEATTIKYVEMVSNGVWIRAENKEEFADKFYDTFYIINNPIKFLGTVVAIKRKL